MGNLERELQQGDKRRNIQKVVLSTIYTAGILGVAMVAPNVLQVMKQFGIGTRKKNLKYSINDSFTRLREKGLIEVIEINGKKVVRVTKKGESKLDFLQRHNFNLKTPKKWDGRWRVIIFDIKESKKVVREQLRATLIEIGFVKLQNSVWIFPYDCEDLVSLLKADFRLGREVIYMVVEKLENDWAFRKLFKLPNSSDRKS